MAKSTIERTDYHNPGANPIVFEQGTSPNDFAEKITVLPGETYKGYVNYKKFYIRKGLKVGPSPTAGAIREEAAAASAEAARMKAEAEEAKLEALEAKREAEAMRAEAELAIAEANSAKAQAALIVTPAQAALVEQIDDPDDDDTEDDDTVGSDDPLAPVAPKKAASKAKPKAKPKAKAQ